MAGPVAAPAAPAAAGAARQAGGGGFNIMGMLARVAVMYMVMQFFSGKKAPLSQDRNNYVFPKFEPPHVLDFYMFISEQPSIRHYKLEELVWSETGITLGQKFSREFDYTYELSQNVQNNGSLYVHAVFAKAGLPIHPFDEGYDESFVFSSVGRLNRYLPQRRNGTGVNLLAGEVLSEEAKKAHKEPRVVVSYLKPNMTIQLVEHFASYPKSQIPPHVGPFLRYDETGGQYYPVVHFNDFWLLRDKLVAANSTLDSLEMHFELSTVTTWWWALMSQMDKSFEQQTTMGLSQEGESDEIKRIFIEGNPYFLALTMAVSMLHSVFDFLAFKNDIGFWKNNRSMEGLSARSVLINAVCQLIILLYLFDNETSFVVLLSSCIGTAIEFWKVTKAFDVSVDKTKFPYIKIKDRASYSTNSTNKHDADAIKILSYVLFPLVVGYTIYTLMYKQHKSWYSWIVSSLVGAVYMFGFILMCPQLYLNYKLKSVAHLPWRQMTYKFLNTIIDDLFAFVIKMPTLHRLAVFRDDLVFLLQLYQRWIYPVDKTRVNEFGFAAEEPQPAVEGAPAAEAAGAAATPALEGPAGGDAKPATEAASAAGVRKRGGKGAVAAAKAEPEERAFDSDDADAGRAGQKKGK